MTRLTILAIAAAVAIAVGCMPPPVDPVQRVAVKGPVCLPWVGSCGRSFRV